MDLAREMRTDAVKYTHRQKNMQLILRVKHQTHIVIKNTHGYKSKSSKTNLDMQHGGTRRVRVSDCPQQFSRCYVIHENLTEKKSTVPLSCDCVSSLAFLFHFKRWEARIG